MDQSTRFLLALSTVLNLTPTRAIHILIFKLKINQLSQTHFQNHSLTLLSSQMHFWSLPFSNVWQTLFTKSLDSLLNCPEPFRRVSLVAALSPAAMVKQERSQKAAGLEWQNVEEDGIDRARTFKIWLQFAMHWRRPGLGWPSLQF